MRELERRVVLSVLDRKWREHLYEMDYLKEGIGLRAMAQRDPLVEYQREGFQLFQAMNEAIKEESVGYLFNLEVEVEAPAASAAVQDDVPVDGFEAARAIRGQGPRGAAGARPGCTTRRPATTARSPSATRSTATPWPAARRPTRAAAARRASAAADTTRTTAGPDRTRSGRALPSFAGAALAPVSRPAAR